MTTIQASRGIIADAEKALRDLIQKEIDEHRYSDIPEIARLADGVARLLRGERLERIAVEMDAPPVATRRVAKRAQPQSRNSRAKKSDYPKFSREGDKLVKVGWSKKSREEYEHRAPRSAALAFARHLVSKVSPGQLFTIEEILPIPDSSGGDVPSYQVYMTLAWLRESKLITKRGRDGYIVTSNALTDGDFDSQWERLPMKTQEIE